MIALHNPMSQKTLELEKTREGRQRNAGRWKLGLWLAQAPVAAVLDFEDRPKLSLATRSSIGSLHDQSAKGAITGTRKRLVRLETLFVSFIAIHSHDWTGTPSIFFPTSLLIKHHFGYGGPTCPSYQVFLSEAKASTQLFFSSFPISPTSPVDHNDRKKLE